VPQRFPEHGELLTYIEAVELLPDDVKPGAANLVWSMLPLATWEDSPTPHVPRPVPPQWRKPPLHGSSSLEVASVAVVQTREGLKHLTLYFDPKRVKEVGKRYATPNKGGRKPTTWRKVVDEQTELKGAPLTRDEALTAIQGASIRCVETASGPALDGAPAILWKSFQAALRDAHKRINLDGE